MNMSAERHKVVAMSQFPKRANVYGLIFGFNVLVRRMITFFVMQNFVAMCAVVAPSDLPAAA